MEAVTIQTSNGLLTVDDRITIRGIAVDSIEISGPRDDLDPVDRAAGYTHSVSYTSVDEGIVGSTLLRVVA